MGFAVVHILRPPAGTRRALAQLGLLVAVGGAAWAALFGYFANVGRYQDFWNTVFLYNRAYAGDVIGNLIRGLTPTYLFPGTLRVGLPLLTLTSVGTALAGSKGPSWSPILAA